MLNKQYTAVLTLAILVTWGATPKSVVSSDRVKSYSFLEDKITALKKDSSVGNRNSIINSESVSNHPNSSQEIILAQDVSPEALGDGTSTEENKSFKLWWLAPLVILVPLLGFLLLKPGSSSKTEQLDEEQTTSADKADTLGVSSPTPQNVNSEFVVDSSVTDERTQEDANIQKSSVTDEQTQEDANIQKNEAIDNFRTETNTEPEILDDIQEQVENVNIAASEEIKTPSESYEQEFTLEDNQSWEQSISPPSSVEAKEIVEVEEIINEPLTTQQSELVSTEVNSENLESISSEESIASETVTQSQPDLLAKTEEMSTQIPPESTEQITDRDLANISEWLNEKIDSDNKDVSVMDDFWDNLSSITEEISGEIPLEQKEQVTDRELADISEWLDEKIDSSPNLSDFANDVDNLADIVEGRESASNEELLISNNLNLEEEQNHNTKTKEGISDSTSNFLEDLLNDDSTQERKH